MCKEVIIDNRARQKRRLSLSDDPPEKWCDIRQDYESGMTLKDIAAKYFCDVRTVRISLTSNTSSNEIGKQRAPTKLEPFIGDIDAIYRELTANYDLLSMKPGICSISNEITNRIEALGYTGSERTVRNYLTKTYVKVSNPDSPEED